MNMPSKTHYSQKTNIDFSEKLIISICYGMAILSFSNIYGIL